MIQSGIYKITNIVNNKIYIGSAFNIIQRWKRHDNSLKGGTNTRHLQNAWLLYGENNFKKEILEHVTMFEGEDRKSFNVRLKSREQHYLDTLKPWDHEIGYNISQIAMGSNAPHTEETKSKISAKHKGKKLSDTTKDKLRAFNLGRRHTQDTKDKISLNAKTNPKYGTKGFSYSCESKLKMRSAKIKSVQQFDLNGGLIKIWESIDSIENELGIYNISRCCDGVRKTAGGYIWKWNI